MDIRMGQVPEGEDQSFRVAVIATRSTLRTDVDQALLILLYLRRPTYRPTGRSKWSSVGTLYYDLKMMRNKIIDKIKKSILFYFIFHDFPEHHWFTHGLPLCVLVGS
jgi:hypothetical protein